MKVDCQLIRCTQIANNVPLFYKVSDDSKEKKQKKKKFEVVPEVFLIYFVYC